jgi:hypothetical protein
MYQMEGREEPDPDGGAGDLELRIADSNGESLYTKLYENAVYTDITHIWIAAPALADAVRVDIRDNGTVVGSLLRSAHSPSVTILAPEPGGVITNATTLSWTTSDADGDSVAVYLQYSHDGGQQWQPLAWDVLAGSMLFDPSEHPGAVDGQGRLRVTASDGFNSTTAEVGALTVGANRAPTVTIMAPDDGATYEYGSNVTLIADAQDREDWFVDSAQLGWTSSVDGPLGSGRLINTASGALPNLSAGVHLVTVTAVDSQGLIGTASVTISIQ